MYPNSQDGTFYIDPLYSASLGDESSTLRTMLDAHAFGKRSLPFFTRWAAREVQDGSRLLALSPKYVPPLAR